MGCLCTKPLPDTQRLLKRNELNQKQNLKGNVIDSQSSTSSVASRLSFSVSTNGVSSKKNVGIDITQKLLLNNNRELSKIITVCPRGDELKLRGWLRKQGHILRSWKKRYFVLASNCLKYYEKPIDESPFGENLCGEVYLRGAIFEVMKGQHKNTVCVKIFGRKGEKDLTIELPSSIRQQWIHGLEWTIRRCTKSYIENVLRSYKLSKVAEGGDDDVGGGAGSRKEDCEAWAGNELRKYSAALEHLNSRRTVAMAVFQYNGRIHLEPCDAILWCAPTSTYERSIRGSIATDGRLKNVPLASLPSRSVGIKYCLSQAKAKRGVEAETFVLSFADILLIRESKTSLSGGEAAESLHHRCAVSPSYPSYGEGRSRSPSSSSNGNDSGLGLGLGLRDCPCSDRCCAKVRNILYTIETAYGLSLQLVACCERDYEDFILDIKTILLYLNLKIPNDESAVVAPASEVDARMQVVACFQAKFKLAES